MFPKHLFVSFTGLCWFAPKYRIDDPAHRATNRMRVLMVESKTSPHELHDHDRQQNSTHEEHIPVLVCPRECVVRDDPYARQPCKYFPEDDPRWAIFPLDDQVLSLEGDEMDLLTVVHAKESECPKITNYFSFHWVAPLAKIEPGSEVLKEGCLKDYRVDDSVVARVEFGRGIIGAWSFAKEYGEIYKWGFKPFPEPSRHLQALADSVLWYLPYPMKRVRFVTQFLRPRAQSLCGGDDDENDHKPIILRFASCRMNLSVKNMPLKDITDDRSVEGFNEDLHFAHLYKLSEDPGECSYPYIAGRCSWIKWSILKLLHKIILLSNFPLHLGRPSCPPAQGQATEVRGRKT